MLFCLGCLCVICFNFMNSMDSSDDSLINILHDGSFLYECFIPTIIRSWHYLFHIVMLKVCIWNVLDIFPNTTNWLQIYQFIFLNVSIPKKIFLYKSKYTDRWSLTVWPCLSVCQSDRLCACVRLTVFCDSLVTPYSKLDFRVLNHHQFKTDAVLGHVTLDLNALLHKHDGKCKCRWGCFTKDLK